MEAALVSKLNLHVFVATFLFVVVCGLLLQWVVLPLTPWYASCGLMSGGDWIRFHALAENMAQKIAIEGWSAWEPRIEGQAPAGVAAAIYAVIGVSHPSVLLPFHGALYGVSAVGLNNMATRLGASRSVSVFVLLPMFIFPSSAMIWGQIHKDIYSLAGIVLILCSWIKVWSVIERRTKITIKGVSFCFFVVFVGGGGVVFVRPYLGELVLIASVLVATLLVVVVVFKRCAKLIELKHATASVAVIFIVLLAQLGSQQLGSQQLGSQQLGSQQLGSQQLGSQQLGSHQLESHQFGEYCKPIPLWFPSLVLPKKIDRKLAALACVRDGFRLGYPNASSNIDVSVSFSRASDILAYIPRALLIGFFAPFPDQLLGAASSSESGRIMRFFVWPEVLFVYLALMGVLFAFFNSELRVPALIVFLFSLVVVLVNSLAITNVGTLYRMRYPFMLTWLVFGAVSWVVLLKRIRGVR